MVVVGVLGRGKEMNKAGFLPSEFTTVVLLRERFAQAPEPQRVGEGQSISPSPLLSCQLTSMPSGGIAPPQGLLAVRHDRGGPHPPSFPLPQSLLVASHPGILHQLH